MIKGHNLQRNRLSLKVLEAKKDCRTVIVRFRRFDAGLQDQFHVVESALHRYRAGCLDASEILSFFHVGRPLAVVEILLRSRIPD